MGFEEKRAETNDEKKETSQKKNLNNNSIRDKNEEDFYADKAYDNLEQNSQENKKSPIKGKKPHSKEECEVMVKKFKDEKMIPVYDIITKHSAYEKSLKEEMEYTEDEEERVKRKKELKNLIKNNEETIKNMKK